MFALTEGRQRLSLFKSMLAWCRAWFKESFDADFGCCSDAEIERLANDMRLSASELRAMIRKGPKAADLVLRRMAALDLDPKEVARLEPTTFRDLQRVCSFCKSHRRCVRDFARNAPVAAWDAYCPNTGTLAALNEQPWEARREW
jgi:hypothetical protein